MKAENRNKAKTRYAFQSTTETSSEEIPQKQVMMWYIPINKIEIRENRYFVPLPSINTYRKQNYLQTKHLVEKNNAKEKHMIFHKVKLRQAQ